MKKSMLAIGVWLTLIALPLVGFGQREMNPPQLPAYNVYIINGAFEPYELGIAWGTTVTWMNNDEWVNSIYSEDELFVKELAPGETFSYTFDYEGVFWYRNLHSNAVAKIVVRPPR